MFEFKIVTLFPEIFDSFLSTSLLGKAIDNRLIQIETINLRDFTICKHKKADDTPYGGGCGMVLMGQPVLDMLAVQPDCYKVLLAPAGRPFIQKRAMELSRLKKPLLLFCGRYEGIDDRVVDNFDESMSIGDFVLNGGEVAAMVIIEAVSRLLPGVIGKIESTCEESFSSGLLEYPQYTRPEMLNDKAVPKVLLSGNHKEIANWRKAQSLIRTADIRPDLFAEYEMTEEEKKLFEKYKEGN